MPIMDGGEASNKIREYLFYHKVRQPIIIGCTGHVEPAYVEKMKKSGMN